MVHFLSGLMEAGTKFVAVDNPNANKLTIHILAAVAEDERERISARTKAALAAAKAKGTKLGNPRLADACAGVNAARQEAWCFAAEILRSSGRYSPAEFSSLRGVAKALSERGVRAARGGAWSCCAGRGHPGPGLNAPAGCHGVTAGHPTEGDGRLAGQEPQRRWKVVVAHPLRARPAKPTAQTTCWRISFYSAFRRARPNKSPARAQRG